MLKFLKAVGAVVVGNLITAGVVFLLMIAALVGLVSMFQTETPETRAAKQGVRDKSVLVLDMDLKLTDTPDARTPGQVLGDAFTGDSGASIGLLDLTRAVDRAAKDKRITAILIKGTLDTEDYAGGYPAVAEVRRALARFRAAGKPVTAYLDNTSIRDYYLATAADNVVIHPFAELPFHGLATNHPYLGAALKKYGIGVQTTKVGVYKSAVEPFTSDHMSEADKTQSKALLDSVWNNITADIAASRKMDAGKLRELADTQGVLDAADAVKLHLADKTAYLDEVIDDLRKKGAEDDRTGSFAQVNVLDYLKTLPKRPSIDSSDDKLVVVYAEGEITDGSGRAPGSFGGEWLASEIRSLRRDDSVKAVVLRVNSPGGSAFASEVARRELGLFRASGRPLVVSMGSLAASGGYWISAGSDRIFAEKTTITGSIGVFGLMFNVQDLAGGFGVKFDGVKTSKYADLETISRPKTEEELVLLQKFTDRIYGDFVKLVAEGRKLPVEDVGKIAQGRVWSGEAALKLGLVDEIGGLESAVAYARKQAGLATKSPLVEIPARREPGEVFAQLFSGDSGRPPVVRMDDPSLKLTKLSKEALRRIATFNDRRGIYARVPYLLEMN